SAGADAASRAHLGLDRAEAPVPPRGLRTGGSPQPPGVPADGMVAGRGPLLRPPPVPRSRRGKGPRRPPQSGSDPPRRPDGRPAAARRLRGAGQRLREGPQMNGRTDAPAAQGAWARFWFAPTDPIGLHVVRVATGLLLIFWLLTLAADAGALFSLNGWFDRLAHLEASRLAEGAPKPASWSLLYLCGQSTAAFQAAFWGSLLVLVLFTLGIAPRVTAPLAWVIACS